MKKGDTVYWQDLKGKIVDDNCDGVHPLCVGFENLLFNEYFTKDGSYRTYLPPVLSLTPYTLEGFSQEKPIEKDTLVYVKYKDSDWVMRYYSHFKDGKHFCFVNQLKSTQTDTFTDWNYCQVENPLL